MVFAQVAANARELAAGALRGDIGIDLAARLLPDFRAGGFVVRLDVVGIVELRRHPVAGWVLPAYLFDLLQGKVDVGFAAERLYHLGAVSHIHLLAFFAHAFGHHDDARVAFDRRDERAGDAGIAGRAFQYGHPFLEVAAPLCPFDHVQVDAIFERPRRAEVFELDADFRLNVCSDAIEPHHRRVADTVEKRFG